LPAKVSQIQRASGSPQQVAASSSARGMSCFTQLSPINRSRTSYRLRAHINSSDEKSLLNDETKEAIT
jgi:hypothetical protein